MPRPRPPRVGNSVQYFDLMARDAQTTSESRKLYANLAIRRRLLDRAWEAEGDEHATIHRAIRVAESLL